MIRATKELRQSASSLAEADGSVHVPRGGSRPDLLEGRTHRVRMGCGNVYITVNHLPVEGPGLPDGQPSTNERGSNCVQGSPLEIFLRLGKSGGCQGAILQGLARVISITLNSGSQPVAIANTLAGISCPNAPPGERGSQPSSCLDALAKILNTESTEKKGG